MMATWRVDFTGKKLKHLGQVEAATADEAVDKAGELFDIGPGRRFKLLVQKIKG
jgi:hypothetical protein